jgi:proteasome accessory factor C
VERELPDGACEAAMTYASDDWMARFVLGFGSAVRVLEPQSLADRVRESAAKALAAYEGASEATGQVDVSGE